MISPARFEWREGRPYSLDFDDIYHDANPADKARRNFLGPTHLHAIAAHRFEVAEGRAVLRVAETGFGTGMNFAAAVEELRNTPLPRFHFVSFDSRPIAPHDFRGIADARAGALPIYTELGEKYPPLVPGWHRRELADGRVTLSLFWGDAREGLADLEGRFRLGFDAWFLDGFAPARNPDLWSPALLEAIGDFSKQGTTLATFTASGAVRRALEQAGFAMRRVDQSPHKRESLAGEFTREAGRFVSGGGTLNAAALTGSAPADGALTVDVAGAGIAGASLARHLAERGCRVRVFERGEITSGASGIPTAILHGRLLGDASADAVWRAHAFLYSASFCTGWDGFARMGTLQLEGPNCDAAKLGRIAAQYGSGERCIQDSRDERDSWVQLLSARAASELAAWPVEGIALFFPGGGVVNPRVLSAALLDHPLIEVRSQTAFETIERVTVLACAMETMQFPAARYLEVAAIPGQIEIVSMTSPPALPIVGNGYLAPGSPGARNVAAGATYEYRFWEEGRAKRENLLQLKGHDYEWIESARGVRVVSSDRCPIAGSLDPNDDAARMTYVSTGHGSMGMTTSHFAAAIIAAQITGGMPPATRDVEAQLAPARFRERQAKRGYRYGAEG